MTRRERIEQIMVEILGRLSISQYTGDIHTHSRFDLDRAYEAAAAIVDFVNERVEAE